MAASKTSSAGARWSRLLLSLLLLPIPLAGSAGCAGMWDDITSRDFEFRALFVKPDPMHVLAHSTDGDKRARALRALREPKQHGGTDVEQEHVLALLTTAAVSEKQPLCRLAAIQSLGRFKDPRAAQSLIDSYYAVTEQRLDTTTASLTGRRAELANTFSPEMVTRIQCQALTALGETGNPMAVELLTTVAREPRPEGQNKQQVNDVRIAATRALARYPHYQAASTLVHVMKTEKDVALRDAAHESLQVSTGKKMPPDPKVWENLLQSQEPSAGPMKTVGYSPGRSNPLAPRPEQSQDDQPR